ncbi:MAG: sterol desaturase family protein [Halobacteriovoraceae bacterium]|nr:sterol desaturase family protein [Halobacteriovoraceae bacterium]
MDIRLGFFLFGLILFMSWETFRPFIKSKKEPIRIGSNLLMGFLGALLSKAVLPSGLFLMAVQFKHGNVGVFNSLHLPSMITLPLTIVLMDLIIYGQHVISHKVPILWKLHRVHHSDLSLDTSSALRFHPLEILFSFGVKMAALAIFGLSPEGIIAFEILLNFSAMFNHSNFQLPSKLEALIHPFIVTPDFHRVHHSPKKPLTNSNYGFFFSLWDTIFGTRNKTHTNNDEFGLVSFRKSESQKFGSLLLSPFTSSRR